MQIYVTDNGRVIIASKIITRHVYDFENSGSIWIKYFQVNVLL